MISKQSVFCRAKWVMMGCLATFFLLGSSVYGAENKGSKPATSAQETAKEAVKTKQTEQKTAEESKTGKTDTTKKKEKQVNEVKKATADQKLIATLETSMGTMKLSLFHKQTPKTVSNFVTLAKKGFYDGLVFHRVIKGFMIQGGDPQGNGMGGPGYKFADEFVATLKHSKKGILSMANSGPNTNGSQFFITLGATSHLDGRHTVFGELVEGADVLDKIGATKTGHNDKPITPVTMKKVTIEGDFTPVDFK